MTKKIMPVMEEGEEMFLDEETLQTIVDSTFMEIAFDQKRARDSIKQWKIMIPYIKQCMGEHVLKLIGLCHNVDFHYCNKYHLARFNFNIFVAYDKPSILRVCQYLKKHKIEYEEVEHSDKSALVFLIKFKMPLAPKDDLKDDRFFNFHLDIKFDATKAGSTCKLVPLETHEETTRVVDTYEVICDNGYEEMVDLQPTITIADAR